MEVHRFAPPTLIEIRGRDRVKWLHSFVTNEIRDLAPSMWREVFVTDGKGRTFSHGCVVIFDARIYFLSLGGGQAADLIKHWDRYIISEDVELIDQSSTKAWYAVTCSDLLDFCKRQGCGPISPDLSMPLEALAGKALSLVAEEGVFAVFGFAVPLQFALIATPAASAREADATTTVRRLAAANRFPWFGVDFDQNNLPQEIARDPHAISFKKGCYLGQETVARLDALGQVQKRLYPVIISRSQSSHALQTTPQELFCGDETAGTLTSSYPCGDEHAVGFAMLRRKHFTHAGDFHTIDGAVVSVQSP